MKHPPFAAIGVGLLWLLVSGVPYDAHAASEAIKVSRGAILQCHGLIAVGKTMRDAATRAMMIEETAKLVLYCKQFGGEMAVIPPEWVERLASVAGFL